MITVRDATSLIISLATAVALAGCIATNHTMQPGDSLPDTAHTATPFDTEAIRQDIIRATNEERAKFGLPALRVEPILMEVAQERAQELTVDFDHRGPEGERLATTKAQGQGYQGQVGENIGLVRTSLTGQAAMRMWCNSQLHHQNMVDGRYVDIGVGAVFVSFNGLYVVQVFGTQ
jgi:uncharacterized protein YkwD